MSRAAFDHAISFYLDTVARISSGQWQAPGLGVWNVRELVSHASRAMTTVEQYSAIGAESAGIGSSDDIAERGREAARALGDDTASAVNDIAADIAARVRARVYSLPDDHPMATPFGQMRLGDYLRSRVAELTIHTLDLADAIGASVEAPEDCMRESLYLLADLAVRRGTGKDIAFGLTGRRTLGEGFTLVP